MFLKTKLFLLATILFLLSLPSFSTKALNIDCSTNQFSDGSTSKTITFPPGGGTNTDAKVRLPIGGKISCASVDLSPDVATLIKTPHIWVPKSTTNQIAQIRTSDGTIIKADYPVGTNPSRTFVIPGGDVWVANRDSGNVTKLSPRTGLVAGGTCGDGTCNTTETFFSCSADCPNTAGACGGGTYGCEEYNVIDSYPTGSGPRGVTADTDGYIWVGNANNGTVVKLNPITGAIIATVTTGGYPYGAIGDPFGQIWISNRSAGQGFNIINAASGTVTYSNTLPSGASYGIGMDEDGNVYIAGYESGDVYKYDQNGNVLPPTFSTGVPTGARGVAVDSQGNVWTANSGNDHLYGFNPAGGIICDYTTTHSSTIGVAVDFYDKVWVVSYDGHVSKINRATCTEDFDVDLAAGLYNYSDMTGLRTLPMKFILGSFTAPVSISGTTTITGWAGQLQAALVGCACTGPLPGPSDDCQVDPLDTDYCIVPLSIYSVTGGEFILDNLQICCGLTVPSTFGGLIPCGRNENNPATPWNDQEPCTVCHFFLMLKFATDFLVKIAGVAALLFLILSGLFYASASGDLQRLQQAKSMFIWVLAGLGIVLLAWLLVTIVLIVLGYIDPLDAQWNFIC